jgi:hypothetical protein
MKIRPNEKSTISKTVQMQCVSIFSLVSDGNIDSPSVACLVSLPACCQIDNFEGL